MHQHAQMILQRVQRHETRIVVSVMQVLADLKSGAKSEGKAKKAELFGPQIIEWFRQNSNIDGDALINMKHKEFGIRMAEHLENRKVKGFTAALYRILINRIEAVPQETEKIEQKAEVYEIGRQFLYWKTQKKHKNYVKAKYENMKEEMLKTGLVSIAGWNKLSEKIEIKLNTNMAKKIKSTGDVHWIYEIAEGLPLDEQHLRALILYTDFTELCKKLCAILRDGGPREVAQIAHWAKTLTETVQCFGSGINLNESTKTYYRGVNKEFVFKMIVSRFHLPQSTTSNVTFLHDLQDRRHALKYQLVFQISNAYFSITCLNLVAFGFFVAWQGDGVCNEFWNDPETLYTRFERAGYEV